MGTMGFSARMCCEYCKIVGIYSGKHIYCPHRAPIDAPATSYALEARLRARRMGYYDFSEAADRSRVNGVGLREAAHFERIYAHYRTHGPDKQMAVRWGIKHEPILNEIDTISLPWSFPPDLLHLLKGIAALLMLHYTGEFTKNIHGKQHTPTVNPNPAPDVGETADAEDSTTLEEELNEGVSGDEPDDDDPNDNENEEDEEDYVISEAEFSLIGKFQDQSRKTVPLSIGGISNISKYSASMKADDWFSWLLQQSPVYLSKFLPDEHYSGYMKFVHIAELLCYGVETKTFGRSLGLGDMETLDALVTEFLDYYENEIYRRAWKRVSACRVLVHQLSHVVETIRRLGPMGNYTQFPIERFIGITDSQIRNKSDTNAHLIKVWPSP